jgi:hypothetical protein
MERLQLDLFSLPPEPIEATDDRQFSKPSRQSRRPKQQLKPLRFGLPEYGPHLEANQRALWAEELRVQSYQ